MAPLNRYGQTRKHTQETNIPLFRYEPSTGETSLMYRYSAVIMKLLLGLSRIIDKNIAILLYYKPEGERPLVSVPRTQDVKSRSYRNKTSNGIN